MASAHIESLRVSAPSGHKSKRERPQGLWANRKRLATLEDPAVVKVLGEIVRSVDAANADGAGGVGEIGARDHLVLHRDGSRDLIPLPFPRRKAPIFGIVVHAHLAKRVSISLPKAVLDDLKALKPGLKPRRGGFSSAQLETWDVAGPNTGSIGCPPPRARIRPRPSQRSTGQRSPALCARYRSSQKYGGQSLLLATASQP